VASATSIAIVAAIPVGIVVVFWLLQRVSDRTYRPTPQQVKAILDALMEGRLSYQGLDEFSCVRIAYDSQLDDIRQRCNTVLHDDRSYVQTPPDSPVQLTESAKARISEIRRDVDKLPA
jgi:hypothetical protein